MPVPVRAESGGGRNRTLTKVRSLVKSLVTLALGPVFAVKYVTAFLLHRQNTAFHRITDDWTPKGQSEIGAKDRDGSIRTGWSSREPANTKVKLTQISLISNDPGQISGQHMDNSFLHTRN